MTRPWHWTSLTRLDRGSYLAEEHTYEHFGKFWVPRVFDRSRTAGSGTVRHSEELLRERTLKLLFEHTPPPMDEGLKAELKKLEKTWFDRLGVDHVYPE